jgi:hypothetical protein
VAFGKHVPSSAAPAGEGPQDATGAVGQHYAAPAASGADSTADMRDGDDDSGTWAPVQPATTVPGSAASEAMRGGGTP